MATNPQTIPGQQWSQLITLFSETKKVYASHEPFLSPHKLGFVDEDHVETIKKANMATFVCGLFGGREDVGFSHLNDFFLETFVAESAEMLKSHTQLFLHLKTQAYISAVINDKAALLNGHRSREDILDALFPSQLDEHLSTRRSGDPQLTPTERDFVAHAQDRRKSLFEESDSEAAILALPKKYPWEDFLKDVHTYVASNFDNIIGNIVSSHYISPCSTSAKTLRRIPRLRELGNTQIPLELEGRRRFRPPSNPLKEAEVINLMILST